MTQIRSAIASLLFVTASGTAFAQGASGNKPLDTIPVTDAAADSVVVPTDLSYSFTEFGYGQTKFDGSDLKADGFGLSGSFALPATFGPSLYVTAGYALAETDEFAAFGTSGTIEITDYRIGAGYRMGLSSTLDLKAELDFLQEDAEGKGGFSGLTGDDTGFRAGLGARFLIAPQIEAGGGLRYVDIGEDSETIFEANGLYHIVRGFSAFVNAATSSDATSFGLGGRYNFNF